MSFIQNHYFGRLFKLIRDDLKRKLSSIQKIKKYIYSQKYK